MTHSAVLTFTARSPQRIIGEGGSQAWRLDADRAKKCEFLVCAQNRHNGDWGGATEPHAGAFIVGRICDVVPSTDQPARPDRWLIQISEYARVNIPEVWQGWRYPVRYTSLEDLGIDLATLAFEPLPEPDELFDFVEEGPISEKKRPFTIADAKRLLAASFGVPETAVEITIRG